MNNTNNNNPNDQNANRPVTAADIPMALKARYFGSGLVVGVFLSPMVKKAMAAVQPKLDGLLDTLTGQAEGLVEKSSDLVAKAKDALRRENGSAATAEHSHAHDGHEHESGSTHTH